MAGDGKLTGAEVKRAQQTGYKYIYDGVTQEMSTGTSERTPGYVSGIVSRSVANKTSNKFAINAAAILDLLLMPLTMPISMVQALTRD